MDFAIGNMNAPSIQILRFDLVGLDSIVGVERWKRYAHVKEFWGPVRYWRCFHKCTVSSIAMFLILHS